LGNPEPAEWLPLLWAAMLATPRGPRKAFDAGGAEGAAVTLRGAVGTAGRTRFGAGGRAGRAEGTVLSPRDGWLLPVALLGCLGRGSVGAASNSASLSSSAPLWLAWCAGRERERSVEGCFRLRAAAAALAAASSSSLSACDAVTRKLRTVRT
jgi:hypothetical protein